jgi:hypothetical protein
MMRNTLLHIPILLLTLLLCLAGLVAAGEEKEFHVTDNVFIVSIDGIRDLEAFSYEFEGDQTQHPYIPFIWNELKPLGTAFMEMYNVYQTRTSAGHATILTGDWQIFPNHGAALNEFQTRSWAPTIFEYARKQMELEKSKTWCVVGKRNCLENNWSIHPAYGEKYGANLIHSPSPWPLEKDSLTVNEVIRVLDTDKPSILFVNLEGVDVVGHYGTYEEYCEEIRLADRAVERIWEKIANDPHYRDNTTLILTTDHGRHDPDNGGYHHHGGICHGCQHVMCLVVGPETPADLEVTRRTYQIDIAPTTGCLLGFDTPFSKGKVLREAVLDFQGTDPIIVKDPAVDVDKGDVCITWADNRTGTDEIYFLASSNSGQTFGDTIQLSNSSVAAMQPDIAIDENGIHVIWLDLRDDIWGIYYTSSEDDGQTWKDEMLLLSNSLEDENGEGETIMWEPTILSEKGSLMTFVAADPISIYALYSYDGGDNWTMEPVEDEAWYPVNTNSARLDKGVAGIWSAQTRNSNWEVFFNRSGELAIDWSSEMRISYNNSYSIQPRIDSNGFANIAVVWADNLYGFFQIFLRMSENRGVSWGNREIMTNSSHGAWQPDIAWVRSTDNVHLVWVDYSNECGTIFHSYFNGTRWNLEERLTPVNVYANQPNFAIDDEGNTFLVWEEILDTGRSLGLGNLADP